jgi:hypothetical protein
MVFPVAVDPGSCCHGSQHHLWQLLPRSTTVLLGLIPAPASSCKFLIKTTSVRIGLPDGAGFSDALRQVILFLR